MPHIPFKQQVLYIAIIVVYVLVMLGVGYISMRRTKSVGDFFLGGRTLGPWMSAFAFGTTYFSAVLFIGYAGRFGWGYGLHTMWIVLGNTIIGTLLAWKLLAGRTREMTTRLNALTMPEFLRARYDSKVLQVVSALVIFILLVPYSASILTGLSYLFTPLGLKYESALLFLTLLTGVYLVMGGYFAVAVSDFIRGIVEFASVMLMVYILSHMKGGFVQTTHALLAKPLDTAPDLSKITPLGPEGMQILVPGVLMLTCLVIITSFGPWALPQMVQKFYSIRRKADVLRTTIIAGVFSIFMAFGAYYSGALAHLYYPGAKPPEEIMDKLVPNFDKLMPLFITTHVPNWLVMVILLLVFSASMSSLSSLVLVSSSAISVDIYGAFVNRQANQRRMMAFMRILCAVFVGLSMLLALKRIDFIANLMMISWGTLSGVFLAPYVYGLFWKRTTKAGVFAGIISSLLCAAGLFLLWGKAGVPLIGAICMIVPMVVVPVVSLFTSPPSPKLIDMAFTENAMETPPTAEEVLS